MPEMNPLDKYFHFMKENPDAFSQSELIHIETDREVIEKYVSDTGTSIGIVYQSPYSTLIVDLIKKPDGTYYTYERMLQTAKGRAVVCLCLYEGKFLLLQQYRHAMRDYQLSFPRGFGEDGLSSMENAKKELDEEISAVADSIEKIGEVIANSGLSGTVVDVMQCHISEYHLKKATEGIADIILMSQKEFVQQIAEGNINDGFTLAAYALYSTKQ